MPNPLITLIRERGAGGEITEKLPDGVAISPNAEISNVHVESYARILAHARVVNSTLRYAATVASHAQVVHTALQQENSVGGHAIVRWARPGGWVSIQANAVVVDAAIPSSAYIGPNGDVRSNHHILTVAGIGSEGRTVTIHRAASMPGMSKPWVAQIVAGCFIGTPRDLAERIAEPTDAWGDGDVAWNDLRSFWQRQYQAVITLAEVCEDRWNSDAQLAEEGRSYDPDSMALRHPNWDLRWVGNWATTATNILAKACAHEIVKFPEDEPTPAA